MNATANTMPPHPERHQRHEREATIAMMARLTAIGFDADDTLWHNETLYTMTQAKLCDLLSDYHDPDWIDRRLYETEMRNLHRFGYGIKSFALSMIETAIELTEGRVAGRDIQQIIDAAKEMQSAPVELLPCVKETLAQLSERYPLILITKGDLFDQESKLARSGLSEYFAAVEILSEKNEAAYSRVLDAHGIQPEQFLMVGNSVRSDILPVKALGAEAIYIPYTITWEHEQVAQDAVGHTFQQLESMCELARYLEQQNGER
jgi:putative hydrolase of the HAD superfamily